MSSENERLLNSSENNSPKKHRIVYNNDPRKSRGSDEISDFKHGANRYFAPPSQILQRQNINPQMPRNVINHPPSPHERNTIKDRPIQPEDSDLTDAMIFLNRIKDEYADNIHIYDNFLETMRDFKFEKIDAEEVCKAIRILFKDKPYLVRLFDEYLPHHLRYVENSRNYELQQDRAKYNQFRAPNFICKPHTPLHMGQMHPNPNMQMARLAHNMPHPNFMPRPMRQSPPPMMNMQVMPEPAIRLMQENQVIEPVSPKQKIANEFIQLVKKRYLNRPFVYKQFLDILSNQKNSFEKVYTQVNSLLSDSPDLFEKFERNFRAVPPQNEPSFTSDSDPLKKIKHILAKKDVLEQFLKAINFYNQNYLSAADLIQIVSPIIQDKENIDALKSFIKYEETPYEEQGNKYMGLVHIGSYRILKTKTSHSAHNFLHRELLNDICKCIPTHESEDDAYIFRNKNHSEELVSRIIDEMSEADLIMDRLKFLIIRLEGIYDCLDEQELEMEDIQMSSALVKETLKTIYDTKSTEILEAILTSPKKAIPVILSRLKKVYRENSSKLREYRKFWRSIVEEHYYKAYDTKGVSYRSQEKNYLSSRHILNESINPLSLTIQDFEVLNLIRELFVLFIESHNYKDSRKASVKDQIAIFDSVLQNINSESLNLIIDFKTYLLYYYILTLYLRFYEIKQIKFDKIQSNPIAVSVNLQEENLIDDRFKELVEAAKDLMYKVIDADRFEEYVRRMTDNLGYKLYNLKKIMSKIQKQINLLANSDLEVSKEEDEYINEDSYNFIKCDNVVTICMINNNQDESRDINN